MTEEIFKVYKVSKACNQYTKIPIVWEVSNYGRVKKNGEIYECKIYGGYLYFGGYRVHRAVAELFIPNPDNKPEIDHIDGNPLNNHYLNLRWCTHKENCNNLITLKRMSEANKGEKNPRYGKQGTFLGKHHTQETKIKLSEARKGKYTGENHPMYGRKGENAPMYGVHRFGEEAQK